MPSVLFVDQDPEALSWILQKVEPFFTAYSLHSTGPLIRYLETIKPDVIVLSDRLEYRKRDVSALLTTLRESFQGRIILLTECAGQTKQALWKERGADDCVLHPTRVRDRLDHLSKRIVELAAQSG